jgi:molybdopterin molybdotransferase
MSSAPGASRLVPVAEHLARILDQVPVLPPERVPLLGALGRVLAEDVASGEDLPPFDNSAVDGFAVRAADVAAATRERPVALRVREHLPAGAIARDPVTPGSAARIMTGAPVPPGADAVVMIEWTDGGSPAVAVSMPVAPGDNVRPRGESVRAGDLVLERGRVLGPAELSMLASLGRSSVAAIRPPRVALLSTGDELVPLGTDPGPGQIRDSNRYGLIAQVAELGATPIDLGLVGDDERRLRSLVGRGLAEADCLVTSGGVSVGDHDLTKRVLGDLGAITSYRVAMKPGMPQVFGMAAGGKPVFGLPGNPVSSLVVFDQFVRPALRKMAGHRQVTRPRLLAVATEAIRKPRGKVHFVRAVVENVDGVLHARPTGPQGSGILRSLVLANALMILDTEVESIAAGDRVPVELLSQGTV